MKVQLTDAQADGEACIGCGKEGRAEDNQIVGTGDTGAQVWACIGGCTVLTTLFGGRR